MEDRERGLPRRFRGADDVARFVRGVLCSAALEPTGPGLLVIGIDEQCELVGLGAQSQRFRARELRAHELCALAATLEADALVLAQFEPPGEHVPALDEAFEFLMLAADCDEQGLCVVDCVVVSGHRWWSLRSLAA